MQQLYKQCIESNGNSIEFFLLTQTWSVIKLSQTKLLYRVEAHDLSGCCCCCWYDIDGIGSGDGNSNAFSFSEDVQISWSDRVAIVFTSSYQG